MSIFEITNELHCQLKNIKSRFSYNENIEKINFSQETCPDPHFFLFAIPHLLIYSRIILITFLAQKFNFYFFMFWFHCKIHDFPFNLNTRGAGPFFCHINSEIFEQLSFGIDTEFSIMSCRPNHNLGVLVQTNVQNFTPNKF